MECWTGHSRAWNPYRDLRIPKSLTRHIQVLKAPLASWQIFILRPCQSWPILTNVLFTELLYNIRIRKSLSFHLRYAKDNKIYKTNDHLNGHFFSQFIYNRTHRDIVIKNVWIAHIAMFSYSATTRKGDSFNVIHTHTHTCDLQRHANSFV